MSLTEISGLFVASSRSNIYLQYLIKYDCIPNALILYGEPELKKEFNLPLSHYCQNISLKDFKKGPLELDLNLSIKGMVRSREIEILEVLESDVNHKKILEAVKGSRAEYFIYSGKGGAILREPLLNAGKKFLHVHPGAVPAFKGSTTLYYSILSERKCSASAFFMAPEIDGAPPLKIKDFPIPEDGRTIDYLYDPCVRAELLLEVIEDFKKKGSFQQQEDNLAPKEHRTYYIIHPILKHLAILSLKP